MRLDKDSKAIRLICLHYGIGEPDGDPFPVSGGLLHRMWCFQTTMGKYALKILNPDVVKRPGIKDIYRLSESMAAAAADAGIPVAPAITVGGDPLYELNGTLGMLFSWVNGAMIPSGSVELQHAQAIGAIMSGIHRVRVPAAPEPVWNSFSDTYWESLVERGTAAGAGWAAEAESCIQQLLAWNEQFRSAASLLAGHLAIGHGDLNPKNVLWEGSSPVIIDWESAGLRNPTMELIDSALSWSWRDSGVPDKELFGAFIRAYRESGGVLTNRPEDAIHGRFGGMLDWLEFNMKRSIDREGFDDAERRMGEEQVSLTLAELKEANKNVEVWSEWVRRAVE